MVLPTPTPNGQKWQRESRNNSTRKKDNINIHHNSPRTGTEVCKIWWLTGTGKHDAPPHASFLSHPFSLPLCHSTPPRGIWNLLGICVSSARACWHSANPKQHKYFIHIYRAYIKYLYSSVCMYERITHWTSAQWIASANGASLVLAVAAAAASDAAAASPSLINCTTRNKSNPASTLAPAHAPATRLCSSAAAAAWDAVSNKSCSGLQT